jgi:nanoRNase/pAp phosphatase (c-di-AMP/oligoRNAs hydrolase)
MPDRDVRGGEVEARGRGPAPEQVRGGRALPLGAGVVTGLSTEEKVARLVQLAAGRQQALILTHDNPDPDSLASAVALGYLLERRAGLPSRITYGGIVGRAENRAMMRVLHLPVTPLSRIDFDEYDLFALVDTQPSVGNHSLPEARHPPDVVIDHHPPRPACERAPYCDVGSHYGATCSILVEYLRAARLEPDPQTATALLYGIKSDTRDLGRQTYAIDVDGYLYLFPRADLGALALIEHPALPARYFRLYELAYKRARVHQSVVEVDLGEVYSPDLVAEIAERLVALEGMKWSLALGSFEGQLIVSMRTNDRRMNAGRLIRSICEEFGGSSGGHGAMAGARLPLEGSRAEQERFRRKLLRRFLTGFGATDLRGTPLLEIDQTLH